jgi:poly(3-hydroxybutyrate) depolymerase
MGGNTAVTTGTDSTSAGGTGAMPLGGMGGATSDSTQSAGGMSSSAGGGANINTTGSGGSNSGGSSPGCGTETSLSSGNATIDVSGTQREYILKLPDGYDASNPYKLIFGLHWLGGQASDVTQGSIGLGDYYGLDSLAQGSAIFVAPNGIDNGWANSGGRDIDFMNALLDLFESELCIDLDRIFSVGFSYGGMMSFAIACDLADRFRAIAPLSGALYSGCGNGTDSIAMWGAHGLSDEVVPINDGRSGLQEVLSRNNCGSTSTAVDPSPCVTYEGCDEGYPVTWCEFDGGHGPQQWQSQPIWEFFSQF